MAPIKSSAMVATIRLFRRHCLVNSGKDGSLRDFLFILKKGAMMVLEDTRFKMVKMLVNL